MSDHRDMSARPPTCVPRPVFLDASDAVMTVPRPAETAGMSPSRGPLTRRVSSRPPRASSGHDSMPKPSGTPLGLPDADQATRKPPEPRRTPSCRPPYCDASLRLQYAPRVPNDMSHPWARPRPRHTPAWRHPGHPVRAHRATNCRHRRSSVLLRRCPLLVRGASLRPQDPKETWGSPPHILDVGRRPGIAQPPDVFACMSTQPLRTPPPV